MRDFTSSARWSSARSVRGPLRYRDSETQSFQTRFWLREVRRAQSEADRSFRCHSARPLAISWPVQGLLALPLSCTTSRCIGSYCTTGPMRSCRAQTRVRWTCSVLESRLVLWRLSSTLLERSSLVHLLWAFRKSAASICFHFPGLGIAPHGRWE